MKIKDYEPSTDKEEVIDFIETYDLKPYRNTYLTLYEQIGRNLMSSLIQSITNTYDYYGRIT